MEESSETLKQFKKEQYIVLAGSIISGILNPLYHIYLTRSLGPERYGHLYLLLSCLSIILIPATTVQTMVATRVAGLKNENYVGLREFIYRSVPLVFLFGLILASFFGIFRHWLSYFFYLPDSKSLFLLGLIFPFALILPLFMGGLQGLQLFLHISLLSVLDICLRFVLTAILLAYGWGENAVLFTFLLGTFLMALIYYFFLRKRFSTISHVNKKELASVSYFFWIFGVIFLFSTISQMDVLYVKHYFPDEAGYYSTASFVGKSLLFLPIPYIVVMVPKVSALARENKATFYIGGHSTVVTVFVALVVSCSFLWVPVSWIHFLFGSQFVPILPYLQKFGFGMTPVAAIMVLIYYNLARGTLFFLPVLLGWFVLLVGVLWVYQLTPLQTLVLYSVSGTIVFLGLFFQTFYRLEPKESLMVMFQHFLPAILLRKLIRKVKKI